VVLPSAADAAAWFVETAHAAALSGAPLDAGAVQLFIALAPEDTAVPMAIESAHAPAERGALADVARSATTRLREAVAAHDEAVARETVTALETEVLGGYRPGRGLGRFEDDVSVALAMLTAYDVGADETHLMMAEELMIGVTRRYWERRMEYGLAANCEAAVALAALASLTGKPEYHERALEVMHGYADTYRDLGVGAAPYVSALQLIS
jgi:uncharacterized protein YyaL (SSP411 family)